MSKVNDFLTEAGVFYLATVDGDQHKVRPLGAHFEMDGKVLFGVGDFKEVYRQLLANPKVEIACAKPDGHWLRYTGRAVFETDPKYAEASLEAMPMLKNIYNEETGHKLMMFHLEDASAVDIPMMGPREDLLAYKAELRTMTDHIQIENEQYPVRDLRLTEYEVTVKVSSESLGNSVRDPEGNYTSREAQLIDELIFFYVPDDMVMNASDEDLEQYIYDHLEW